MYALIQKSILAIFLVSIFSSTLSAQNNLPSPPKGILKLSPYQAPSIQLTDIDGEKFNLDETKGSWVFVHFWASWCGPCREEMPAIQKMWQKLEKKRLKMALINTSEDEDTVFSFISIYAPDIRALMDRDGDITEKWNPRGLPATYLVDKQGLVQYQALGGREWQTETYSDFLLELINKH